MDSEQHDLSRPLDALWQCLSQGKRPLAVLLGAGCPVSIRVPLDGDVTRPLIPDIAGLTRDVSAALESSSDNTAFTSLMAGLREDLSREPNIEDMLTRLRTLTTVAGGHTVRGLTGPQISDLERDITRIITDEVSVHLPKTPTPYDDLAIWIGSVDRSSAIRLFTTNYDLLAEQGLERNETPYFDGFVGAGEPFLDHRSVESDDLPDRWARLWKLHGSANWTLLSDGRVVRRPPSSDEEQRLIHPSHLKYDESRRMPYLVMQDQLRRFLREHSATLVTVGYSYGDDHINEQLDQGLGSNPTGTVFALMHGELEKYAEARRLASSNPNLALLARDGGVLAGQQSAWAATPSGDPSECRLGDFHEFGNYLRRLVGRPGVRGEIRADDN